MSRSSGTFGFRLFANRFAARLVAGRRTFMLAASNFGERMHDASLLFAFPSPFHGVPAATRALLREAGQLIGLNPEAATRFAAHPLVRFDELTLCLHPPDAHQGFWLVQACAERPVSVPDPIWYGSLLRANGELAAYQDWTLGVGEGDTAAITLRVPSHPRPCGAVLAADLGAVAAVLAGLKHGLVNAAGSTVD